LPHSASFHSRENNAPSNAGTKQLDNYNISTGLLTFGYMFEQTLNYTGEFVSLAVVRVF